MLGGIYQVLLRLCVFRCTYLHAHICTCAYRPQSAFESRFLISRLSASEGSRHASSRLAETHFESAVTADSRIDGGVNTGANRQNNSWQLKSPAIYTKVHNVSSEPI